MIRRLWLVNLLLLVLIAAGVWKIRANWLEAEARKGGLLAQAAPEAPAPAVPIAAPPQPVTGAQFLEIATELLTTKDRNPNVVIDVVAPKPPPPFPRFYGAMDFGDGLRVVLSEKAGSPQKSYKIGDSIGQLKIVSVSRAGIDFDWDGKQLFAKMADLRDTTPVQQAPPPQQQPAAQAPPASSGTTVIGGTPDKPGSELTADLKACQPGDTSPTGTVVDGYRKVISQTPFGSSCRWERVK